MTQTQISTLNRGLKSFVVLDALVNLTISMHVLPTWPFWSLCFQTFSILAHPPYTVKLLLEITGPKTMFKLRKLMRIWRNFGTWWPKNQIENKRTKIEIRPNHGDRKKMNLILEQTPRKRKTHLSRLVPKNEHKNCVQITDLAQPISWMTDPQRRKVQLKANPIAFQYGPNKPSSTSNHCKQFSKKPRSESKLVLGLLAL